MLKRFDQFCLEQFPEEKTVTKAMMDIWGTTKPPEQPGTLRSRVTVTSHLATYIASLGEDAYIYSTNELPKEPKYIPYIFSGEELQRLFRQIDCCHYLPDVDSEPHVLLRGKGNKSRYVLIVKNVAQRISAYITENHLNRPECMDMPLFFNQQHKKLTRDGVSYIVAKYANAARAKSPLIP